MYVNGEKVLWESVFDFTYCYEKKLASFKPEYYCFGYESDWEFNIWGCMRTGMSFNEHQQWFTWGKWISNEGDWQFDKERIQHELAKNLHSCRYCPALNTKLVQEVLEALPDSVNPKKNKNWKFIETYQPETNALEWTTNQFGYEQTCYIKGVAPNGREFLKDISENLKRKLPDFIKTE